MIKTSIVKCRSTGDPWVPVNPRARDWAKFETHHGYGFFSGFRNFSWVWVGIAKSNGFVPVAIPILDAREQNP
jgi:hypothetical protein